MKKEGIPMNQGIKNNICRIRKIDIIFAARTKKGLAIRLVRMPSGFGEIKYYLGW